MDSSSQAQSSNLDQPLNSWTKLAFGAGDLGPAITANVTIFFQLIFFTNVAGTLQRAVPLILTRLSLINTLTTLSHSVPVEKMSKNSLPRKKGEIQNHCGQMLQIYCITPVKSHTIHVIPVEKSCFGKI